MPKLCVEYSADVEIFIVDVGAQTKDVLRPRISDVRDVILIDDAVSV